MFRPLGEEALPEIKAYYRVGLAYSSTALEVLYTESETRFFWKILLLEESLCAISDHWSCKAYMMRCFLYFTSMF